MHFIYHVAMWLLIDWVRYRLYRSWHWPGLQEAHVLGRQDCCLSRLEDEGWWQGQTVPQEEVEGEEPCPRLPNKAGQVPAFLASGTESAIRGQAQVKHISSLDKESPERVVNLRQCIKGIRWGMRNRDRYPGLAAPRSPGSQLPWRGCSRQTLISTCGY